MSKNVTRQYFKNKRVLITGGTGSIGEYLLRTIIDFDPKRVVVFSRDELKQFELRNTLKEKFKEIEFRIGDVRDYDSLYSSTKKIDLVYHAAAMKHVPICEENPMEAVFTNTYGAYNLKKAAIKNNVEQVVAISTDKAVRSVNVMGMSKAIAERILLTNKKNSGTKFSCVRFGNVIGSRGSVVPLFYEKIKKKKPIPITDRKMTRFLIDLEGAMNLVLTATLTGKGGEIFVKKMPVCEVVSLAEVMIENIAKVKAKDYAVNFVGLREGEQLYETLVSEEEMGRTVETSSFFTIYKRGKKGAPDVKINMSEYRTDLFKTRMSKSEIEYFLRKDNWI